MTARLDLLAHGASAATRATRFPDDEPLEASAVSALEALRGRLRPYAEVLISPARAARETAAALGFDAEVEMALSDCDYGRWRGLASKEVAEREANEFATWLADPAAAPHGGESFAALIERIGAWLTQSLAREGATLVAAFVFLVAVVIFAQVMPPLNEVPEGFPAVVLWQFRMASLGAQAMLWTVLGLGFGAWVQRDFAEAKVGRLQTAY